MRRAFASSFAAVKRRAPCSQIKLQMVSRSPNSTEPWPPRPLLLQDELSAHIILKLLHEPAGADLTLPSTEEEAEAQSSRETSTIKYLGSYLSTSKAKA